jgi:hypothetical protein
VTFEDLRRKELKPEEPREVLRKFEPGKRFYKFRNTAIYYSLKLDYDLCLQKTSFLKDQL